MKSEHLLCVISITLLLLGSSHFIISCVARNTITANDLLKLESETLVSDDRKFELGIFTPNGSTDRSRYVGIWYFSNDKLPKTVVWVANRDSPLPPSVDQVVLTMEDDGNLKLLDGKGQEYFSTGLASSLGANRAVMLLDSGNLALIDGQSGNYLWQSFENPTDTFLPGMRMDGKLNLTSWIRQDDPGTGNYTFKQDKEDETKYFIVKRTDLQGKGDLQSDRSLLGIEFPDCFVPFLLNFSRSPDLHRYIHKKPRNSQLVIPTLNPSANCSEDLSLFSNSRLIMNSSGELQFYGSFFWSKSYDPCSVYNPCGKFGICRNNEVGMKTCDCLPGFEPISIDDWKIEEFSGGCDRKTPCSKNTNDTFLNLKSTKVGNNYTKYITVSNETECRNWCLSSCECQAYSYSSGKRNRIAQKCSIWMADLLSIQMDDQSTDSISISIRVALSDIESTRRDCETCGKYLVPYPLSSASNCGDPSYYSFFCDDNRGQLQFLTSKKLFDVINIDKDRNRFVIQFSGENTENHCDAGDFALNQSSPFRVTNCNDSSDGEYSKIEISWKPPLEPLCNSSLDCFDWPNSMCNKTSGDRLSRCLCIPNYHWDGLALNCTSVEFAVAPSVATPKKKSKLIVSITVIAAFLVAGSFSYIFFRRRIIANRENIPGNPMPYLNDNEMQNQDMVVEENKVTDVPFFNFESIITATDNFSDANKLGRGGFGPVYKGVFPGGKELAVKRLSSHSGQGIREFQNEVRLIAKLQHRNLVRLLGYCIRGSEKLLLYEYMINKSLDTFIFDEGRCMLLDWEKRFEIILGITRGLLYLHQDSRLRVIHRDLKTSNILLDEELNPKISDFGLARIVGGKETEANTERVVGTYGYMSPEYALEGLFSIKSDVFSFGVILLEIISGKRNIGFYEEVFSLLGYAWKLWQERNPMEFINKNLMETCKSSSEVLKCINIGLLCVQEDPIDRPTMADVLMMLCSETAAFPRPNQPAFISRKRTDSSISGSSSTKLDSNSINKMTASAFEGR